MLIIAISGASGAGKTTLQTRLLDHLMGGRVISNTTRTRRESDTANEYRFLNRSDFLGIDDWLWMEEIHGNLYGTRKSDVDVVLRHKGIASIIVVHQCHPILKKAYDNSEVEVLCLHLLSPDEKRIRERLVQRGDALPNIERRLIDCRDWDTEVRTLQFVHLVQAESQEAVFQQCLRLVLDQVLSKRPG